VELEPNFPEALYNLGTIRLEQRQATAAVGLLEQSIVYDPDHVPAYNNLAKAYFLAGYAEMAGAAYEEALARDPDNRVALEGLAALARGAGADEAEQLYRSRLRGGS
jgi:tetratricopeptide (TPR) repeat protein